MKCLTGLREARESPEANLSVSNTNIEGNLPASQHMVGYLTTLGLDQTTVCGAVLTLQSLTMSA